MPSDISWTKLMTEYSVTPFEYCWHPICSSVFFFVTRNLFFFLVTRKSRTNDFGATFLLGLFRSSTTVLLVPFNDELVFFTWERTTVSWLLMVSAAVRYFPSYSTCLCSTDFNICRQLARERQHRIRSNVITNQVRCSLPRWAVDTRGCYYWILNNTHVEFHFLYHFRNSCIRECKVRVNRTTYFEKVPISKKYL